MLCKYKKNNKKEEGTNEKWKERNFYFFSLRKRFRDWYLGKMPLPDTLLKEERRKYEHLRLSIIFPVKNADLPTQWPNPHVTREYMSPPVLKLVDESGSLIQYGSKREGADAAADSDDAASPPSMRLDIGGFAAASTLLWKRNWQKPRRQELFNYVQTKFNWSDEKISEIDVKNEIFFF